MAKVVDGECGENIVATVGRSGGAYRTGKYFVIHKGDGQRIQAGIGGNANIDAAKRSGSGVFCGAIGRHESHIEISLARAGAGVAVHFDLRGDVSAVGWY